MKKYQIMDSEEMATLLNDGIINLGRDLPFSFDIRKNISDKERELSSKFYYIQLISVGNVICIVAMDIRGRFFESKMIENGSVENITQFIDEYGEKYCSKYKKRLCVDMDTWAESDSLYVYFHNNL